MNGFSEQDCIEALKEASETTKGTLTMRKYNKLNLKPASSSTIAEKFGNWNKAKEKAGLNSQPPNNKIKEKPSDLELPEDKKWKELTPYQRYYYKNREKEKERTKKRTEELKKWFKDYKKKFKCSSCGEDHPACLDFHHKKGKEAGVTELVSRRNTSKERIKEEIEKCQVLCANCHRKRHHNN
jgi:transcription elongation factor Elf1